MQFRILIFLGLIPLAMSQTTAVPVAGGAGGGGAVGGNGAIDSAFTGVETTQSATDLLASQSESSMSMISSSASASASMVSASVSSAMKTLSGSGSSSAVASLNSVASSAAAAATSKASNGNIVSPWDSVGIVAPVVLAVGVVFGAMAI
jgi:ElaB/YqjD/DUF883 family membrane-anchored ribosome-binding protein